MAGFSVVREGQPVNEEKKIPAPTVERMSVYLACLKRLAQERVETVSSSEIGVRAGSNAAQVRKDLSYFGEFGTPGVGYNVIHLRERIVEILGLRRGRDVILAGAGSLGTALCGYQGFSQEGFRIRAVFDNDVAKIGRHIGELEIYDIARLAEINAANPADMAMIAVPASAAQWVAERLVEAGITCILNFAPAKLTLPPEVIVRDVDLSRELAVLSYYLRLREAR